MRREWVICALLLAITLGIYWPVREHGFIHFDDPEFITENKAVKQGLTRESILYAFTTPVAANWHPVTTLSHILDVEFFGLNAGAHHLMSLAIHILNSLLLFLWLNQATGAIWRSAAVASIFALHPLRVESVAWIAERKDVLSGMFFFLTLMAYSSYVRRLGAGGQRSEVRGQKSEGGGRTVISHQSSAGCGQKSEGAGNIAICDQSSVVSGQKAGKDSAVNDLNARKGSYWFYALALLAFACGLMSKPMLVTLPCVLLLLDVWPLQRWKIEPRNLKSIKPLLVEKMPFFTLTGLFCWVTLATQEQAGAMNMGGAIPLADRLFNAIGGYLGYLGKFFWPTNLAVLYPHPAHSYGWVDRWPEWQLWAGSLALGLLSILAAMKIRRGWWFTGWFWFMGMLVPVIGIVQVGDQSMADRYAYLPLIGLSLVAVWLGHGLCGGRGGEMVLICKKSVTLNPPFSPSLGWTERLACGAAVVAILALGWQAHRQVKLWRDTVTLFENTLRVTADNPTAHLALGTGLEEQGRVTQAMAQYYAALRIEPHQRMAHYNLGQIFRKRGLWREAAVRYEAALREKPNDLSALLNYASVLPRVGRTAEAISRFEEALRLDPTSVEGLNNLSWILATAPAAEQRNGQRAVELAQKACEFTNQAQPGILGTLAAAYAEAGRFPEAIFTAEKAIALAQETGNKQLVEINRGLLEKYKTGQAHRDDPPGN